MNTIKKYKKELESMFIASVSKDLDKWTRLDDKWDYRSPDYNTSDNKRIYFRTNEYYISGSIEIECNGSNYGEICYYSIFKIPVNIKIWRYVKKIKKSIKNKEYFQKNKKEIDNYKYISDNLQPIFIKEVRKEKLNSLK